MRIIIAASGSQHKWNEHLDVPSHLCPLTRHGGVPLIHRTVEQCLEYTHDVITMIPDDERYLSIPGEHRPIYGPRQSEFEASQPLWNEDGRTVLLLGDVYFTQEALDTIMGHKGRDYRAFGRYRASEITGTPYGELFAASWWPVNHHDLVRHLDTVHSTRAAGTVTRPPGWMLLRAFQGTPLGKHLVNSSWFTEINDETDDIDFPADYDRHPATRSN